MMLVESESQACQQGLEGNIEARAGGLGRRARLPGGPGGRGQRGQGHSGEPPGLGAGGYPPKKASQPQAKRGFRVFTFCKGPVLIENVLRYRAHLVPSSQRA